MKEGYIDKFDLERIITAVEHEMDVEPIEKPEVIVTDKDSDSQVGHVVNLKRMDCTCDDYEYNCKSEEKDAGDSKYCKHIFRTMFVKLGMLEA